MSRYQPLKGFTNIHDYGLNNNIQDALIEYFDWALLDIGNYFNVSLGETAPNGQDMSKLMLASNDSYASGQVWEGFRGNWVWQSGISIDGMDPPIVGTDPDHPGISGVYVNGQFEPTSGVGQYSHHVDYFNGRVVFDSPIPTGSTVQAEFSYKYINVAYANNVPWLRELQTGTSEPSTTSSWDRPPESKLQLPAIAFEIVPIRRFKGYQLGGGQWVYTDVVAHCIAEDDQTRNMLIDVVSLQNYKTIHIINSDKLNAQSGYQVP